jgi:phage-related protein
MSVRLYSRRNPVSNIQASKHCKALGGVLFADVVYVLHTFQKKAKSGIATPRREMELVQARLAAAERDYRERRN